MNTSVTVLIAEFSNNNSNKKSSFNEQMANEKIEKEMEIRPQVPPHLPLLGNDV